MKNRTLVVLVCLKSRFARRVFYRHYVPNKLNKDATLNTPFKFHPSHGLMIAALLASAVACYFLLEPYINSIVMAFIISLLINPIHEWIESKMPKYRNTAAVLSCLVLIFIIVMPALTVVAAIAQQGVVFTQGLFDWVGSGGVNTAFESDMVVKGLAFINQYSPFDAITVESITVKITEFASTLGSTLLTISTKILGDATSFLMDFFLMLFVLFFLLRDNDKIISTMRHILPFSRSQEDRLLGEIENVSKSAVLGSFLTAIAQGLAGGFAMWLAGFPGLFWGTMMGFASFIPVVGTALIWVPATIYLFVTGDTTWAIFLGIWCVLVVGSIDNILRPLLMQGSAGMNTIMIFFSLLGGINLFGLLGLIYGPLIFAISIVLFKLYEEEFEGFLNQQDRS
ncbi:AI-2E family transporter [Vibrio sp. 188UL20-2]|uniref:AI-2E family transporter n=2 Tax=Vibrio ulleungensis TaxID=2807619 RepID=A0ABS2HLA7_9VIBR|nr:AI-2E family transporter [Vibrio ulleungensis]